MTAKLTLAFNGETYSRKTKDMKKYILSLKPDWLHTDMFVTLENKDNDTRERHLNLRQGKQLFNNEDFLDVFVLNLMLK